MSSGKRKRKELLDDDEEHIGTREGKHPVTLYSQCSASVQSRRRTQLYHAICELAGVDTETASEEVVQAECAQLLAETLKKTAPAKALFGAILDSGPLDSVMSNVKAMHESLPVERRNGVLALVANVFTGTELQQRWGFEFGSHQLRSAKQMATAKTFSVESYKRVLPPSRQPKSDEFVEGVVQFITKHSADSSDDDGQRTITKPLRALHREFLEQSPPQSISYTAFRALVLSRFKLREAKPQDGPEPVPRVDTSLSLRPIKPLSTLSPFSPELGISTASLPPNLADTPMLSSRIPTIFQQPPDIRSPTGLTLGYGSQQFPLLASPVAAASSASTSAMAAVAAAAATGVSGNGPQPLWPPQPPSASSLFMEPGDDHSQIMSTLDFTAFGVEPIQSLQSLSLPSLAPLTQRDHGAMLQPSMQSLSEPLRYSDTATSPAAIFRPPPPGLMGSVGLQAPPGAVSAAGHSKPVPDEQDAYGISSIHRYFDIPASAGPSNPSGDDQADASVIAPDFFYF
ncbi:hypothetical protein GQ54DRAFT_300878 [Martensiomyces pterosporus]|nr:hypothetical protein GQ54DRAFT_300878 [Martensiomyces pterosporus]